MTTNYPPELFLQLATWHPFVKHHLEGWRRGLVTWEATLQNCIVAFSIECKAHLLALELDPGILPLFNEVPAEELFGIERQSELIGMIFRLVKLHKDLVDRYVTKQAMKTPVIDSTTPMEPS